MPGDPLLARPSAESVLPTRGRRSASGSKCGRRRGSLYIPSRAASRCQAKQSGPLTSRRPKRLVAGWPASRLSAQAGNTRLALEEAELRGKPRPVRGRQCLAEARVCSTRGILERLNVGFGSVGLVLSKPRSALDHECIAREPPARRCDDLIVLVIHRRGAGVGCLHSEILQPGTAARASCLGGADDDVVGRILVAERIRPDHLQAVIVLRRIAELRELRRLVAEEAPITEVVGLEPELARQLGNELIVVLLQDDDGDVVLANDAGRVDGTYVRAVEVDLRDPPFLCRPGAEGLRGGAAPMAGGLESDGIGTPPSLPPKLWTQ